MIKLAIYYFVLPLILPLLIFTILKVLPYYFSYTKSNYKDASKNSFIKTITDKGNFGEFLTFTYLEKLDIYKRLMTNLYLPKEDGTTTEIDILMISSTGIYVIESKNYSGWIFGDERYKSWTQSLKSKQKNQFFNPIWQNKGHINALKRVLGIDDDNLYKSLIVFSERCELKKVNVTSHNIKVIKRDHLIKTIKEDIDLSARILSIDKIEQIHTKLLEFAYVDEIVKENHIKQIMENK